MYSHCNRFVVENLSKRIYNYFKEMPNTLVGQKFFWTRKQIKIKYIKEENIMKRTFLSLSAAFVVLVCLSACRADDTEQTPPLETVVSETASEVETETKTAETNIETIIIADREFDINTEELILYGADLTNDNLEKLTKFKELKKLSIDLYSYECEPFDLEVLSKLDSIEELYINGAYTDLSFLNGMTNLRSLTLEHFFCDTLENISPNVSITSFSCSQSEIDDLQWLADLAELEEISFSHFSCADFTPIGEITGLKSLTMVMIDNYDVDLRFMENLTSLEKFNYYPIHKTKNIESISSCTKLTDLEIYADIDNLDFISGLLNLQSFSFYSGNQNIYNISVLENCRQLQNVSLSCKFREEELNNLKQILTDCEFDQNSEQ